MQTHEHNNNISNTVTINSLKTPLDAILAVPGSKSLANRAILLAAAAEGESRLTSVPASADIRAALSALENLGIAYEFSSDYLTVRGCGLASRFDGTACSLSSLQSG